MRSIKVETKDYRYRFTPTRELGPLEAMERLGFGQVPTTRILNVLKTYGVDPSHHCNVRALYRYKITGYMGFDPADRLLVDAGLVMSWRRELNDLYQRVNLKINANTSKTPRVHATTKMYRTGCRCVPCTQIWTQGVGRREKAA